MNNFVKKMDRLLRSTSMVFSVLFATTGFSIAATTLYVDTASAAVRARATGELNKIENAEVFTLVGVTPSTIADEVVAEIGKRVRQSYYRMGYEVRGYNGGWVDQAQALLALKEPKGEFRGISTEGEAELLQWIADKDVDRIEAVSLETNYHGGTGLEDVYIFVPKMPATEVLVIRAFWYAE
ncbi:MAG: hypothetical protein J0L82_12940 [Deltaproteobacteria bacterium]|nr:hypothetical protein [Deltaproteobacteria bacterium]